MGKNNREIWAWISEIEGIHYGKIKKLIKAFGNIKNIYNSDEKQLMQEAGLDKEEASRIVKSKEKFKYKDFLEKLNKKKIKFVTVDDEEYPARLMPYEDKPYYLFYKGKLPNPKQPIVAW